MGVQMEIVPVEARDLVVAGAIVSILANPLLFRLLLGPRPKPKPEAAWPKIIEGKFNKWYSETALLEQESVVTKTDEKGTALPAQKITKLLESAAKAAGTTVSVVRFVRYERGEGIEKKTDDFAAEVAKMASA